MVALKFNKYCITLKVKLLHWAITPVRNTPICVQQERVGDEYIVHIYHHPLPVQNKYA